MAIALLLTVSVYADTIRLKDGSRIKGRIVKFGGGSFTIVVGKGQRRREVAITADEVDSIQFDVETAASQPLSRIAEVPYQPAAEPASKIKIVQTDNAKSNPRQAAVSPVVVSSAPAAAAATRPIGKPIELSVKVHGDNTANGWTNSGWVVKKGQKIRVSGSGSVSLGAGRSTTPSGLYDMEDGEKLLRNVPTGALIAVIGDDNNDFIYIGADREFIASRDGSLFLGLNEGNLNDNSGTFEVKVEIFPGAGE
ncbi:MAG: hypothetical protein LC730_02295 [Acidobacteria bacterium]|nr:hypothetical protein [Acidobacteriota bacterium]MCA1608272.1 hypothetical protein [Acidobacteriota bacterium]